MNVCVVNVMLEFVCGIFLLTFYPAFWHQLTPKDSSMSGLPWSWFARSSPELKDDRIHQLEEWVLEAWLSLVCMWCICPGGRTGQLSYFTINQPASYHVCSVLARQLLVSATVSLAFQFIKFAGLVKHHLMFRCSS